jgi:hypothetical protein
MRALLAVFVAIIVAGAIALAAFFILRPPIDLSTSANSLAPPRPRPTTAVATPRPATTGFNGTFEGDLEGDAGSTAPAVLELVQDGSSVQGTFTIDEGLFIDGGRCGEAEVPAGTQSASGTVDRRDPQHMTAEVEFEVSGIAVTITLDGRLSDDNRTLTGTATADLPFLCGRDPVITGELIRQ